MIRGLVGVVPDHALEPGRFYLATSYGEGAILFQCVQTDEPVDDGFRRRALVFTTGETVRLELCDLPHHGPFVALDDVHVRVDPTSVAESPFTAHLRSGLFVLDGDQPILCASMGFRGYRAVNLSTGHTINGQVGHGWLSFTRWSLVVDDEAGEELVLADLSGGR